MWDWLVSLCCESTEFDVHVLVCQKEQGNEEIMQILILNFIA